MRRKPITKAMRRRLKESKRRSKRTRIDDWLTFFTIVSVPITAILVLGSLLIMYWPYIRILAY